MVFRKIKYQASLLFTVLVVFLSLNSLHASKPALGVTEFQAVGVTQQQARKVSRYIETALYKTERFDLVTRQLLEVIELERESQKSNINQVLIEQGIAVGADFIVKGSVTSFRKGINRATNREGVPLNKIYTSTQIKYQIKIINVKSGVLLATDTYKGSINGIDHHIRNFIRSEFPYDFSILKIIKKKGNKKAKHVLLDGGFRQGLRPNVWMEVFEVSEENVDGHLLQREVKIGDLYVKKLDTSGDFSLCLVASGKNDIFNKLESRTKVICKVPKKFRMLGMNFEYEY